MAGFTTDRAGVIAVVASDVCGCGAVLDIRPGMTESEAVSKNLQHFQFPPACGEK